MRDEIIKVELSVEDAALFIQFQKRYLFMKMLEEINAFSMKSGSITIHFTNLGEIGAIDVQNHYRLPN